MKSSRDGQQLYIGADLTDRYAILFRPIDVCGLEPTDNGEFKASFWQWFWDPALAALDVGPLLTELRAARCSMLDGPQGLARPSRSMRECDRASAAAGKVPDHRPERSLPFGGFVCSSLDFFAALAEAGLEISPASPGTGVGEVYPGAIWPRLARGWLPKKTTKEGIAARVGLLGALGVVGLPASANHDQLDAALGAVVAAAAAGAIAGVSVECVGDPLYRDETGVLREGPMIFPVVKNPALLDRLGAFSIQSDPPRGEQHAPPDLPSVAGGPAAKAQELLRWFVDQAVEGRPHVCTYSWVYTYLTGERPPVWSQAYAQEVIRIALSTTPRDGTEALEKRRWLDETPRQLLRSLEVDREVACFSEDRPAQPCAQERRRHQDVDREERVLLAERNHRGLEPRGQIEGTHRRAESRVGLHAQPCLRWLECQPRSIPVAGPQEVRTPDLSWAVRERNVATLWLGA